MISELTLHGGIESLPPGSGGAWGCQLTHLSAQVRVAPPICKPLRAIATEHAGHRRIRTSSVVQEYRRLHPIPSPIPTATGMAKDLPWESMSHEE